MKCIRGEIEKYITQMQRNYNNNFNFGNIYFYRFFCYLDYFAIVRIYIIYFK